MLDLTKLNAAISGLTTQVSATESVEGSAAALIEGFAVQIKTAVADALTADAAANQGSIDAANSAITAVTARFTASAGALGAAIAPPPPPPPAV